MYLGDLVILNNIIHLNKTNGNHFRHESAVCL